MLYKKKEKKPNTAVKYEVREFIHGGIEYATDCPFGECGRYTHALHKVGAIECNLCRYQKKNNTEQLSFFENSTLEDTEVENNG